PLAHDSELRSGVLARGYVDGLPDPRLRRGGRLGAFRAVAAIPHVDQVQSVEGDVAGDALHFRVPGPGERRAGRPGPPGGTATRSARAPGAGAVGQRACGAEVGGAGREVVTGHEGSSVLWCASRSRSNRCAMRSTT